MANETMSNLITAGIFAFLADSGKDVVTKLFSAGAEAGVEHLKKDFFGGWKSPVDEQKDSEILQDMPIMARRVWEGIEYRIQSNYGPGFFSQYFGVRNASKRRVEWAAQAVDNKGQLLGARERCYIVQMFLRERRAQIKKGLRKDESLLVAQSKVEAYLYMRGFPMPKGDRFLKQIDKMIPETLDMVTGTIKKIKIRSPQGNVIIDHLQQIAKDGFDIAKQTPQHAATARKKLRRSSNKIRARRPRGLGWLWAILGG